ncbi:MAG: 2Fe-2S iron-sulfur cluster-binding protein, partial [Candidatus Woesearchaeota archaeon]
MQVKINGKKCTVDEKDSILEACHKLGIEIPHLCYHPDLKPGARCRLCLVKVDGKIVTSCNTYFKENISIITEDEELEKLRKLNLNLIF